MFGSRSRFRSLSFWLYRKNAPAPMATMPAANPSSPSIRLIAWVITSSQMIVTSGIQSSDSTNTPRNGSRK
jgi:hypothetical protein